MLLFLPSHVALVGSLVGCGVKRKKKEEERKKRKKQKKERARKKENRGKEKMDYLTF
jgi:hypothetical protein